MRKLSYAIVILLATLTFSYAMPLNKQALAETSIPNDCVTAGQPSITDSLGGGTVNCHHIYYEGNLGFSFIQTWDPSWDYETYAGSLLGGPLYDMPVTYAGLVAGVAGLGATSGITNIADNNAGQLVFTIRSGIHAHEIDGTGTLKTYGPLTGVDWGYSILRALAACNAQGPASAVYIWIQGANDWLNTCTGLDPTIASNASALSTGWTTFLGYNSITSNATTFTLKTDSGLNNTVTKYTPFLGVLANSWAVVYPESVVEAKCGAIVAGPGGVGNKNLNEQCHGATGDQFFDDNGSGQPRSIGSGPYILDQKLTNLASGVIYLRHNDNYCSEHGGAGTCDMIGTTNGPIQDANRPTYIVITEVTDELSRSNAMNVGTYDHSVLAPTSYPTFLQAAGPSSPPPYNDILASQAGKFNFHIIPSLVVQQLQMIVHCNASDGCSNATRGALVEYSLTAVSPLLGDCPSSPGCHVRQAVQLAFNYASYINNIVLGLGTPLASMIPDGLPSGNTCAQGNAAGCTALGGDLNTGPYSVSLVHYNTSLAVNQLLLAGYSSTNRVPHLECIYNAGNDARARSCVLLSNTWDATLRSCNDPSGSLGASCQSGGLRFDSTCPAKGTGSPPASGLCRINVGMGTQAPASSYLSGHVYKGLYDIAGTGWFPDYVDEDDYARPYFFSTGTFQINGMGFNSPTVDSDINAAAVLPAGTSRDHAYFKIQSETNSLCHCFVWLNQPSGRSIWNDVMSTHVFDRLANPAFLPYYFDIQKNMPNIVPPTPVFNLLGAVILSTAIALGALVVFRRTTPRRILSRNTV